MRANKGAETYQDLRNRMLQMKFSELKINEKHASPKNKIWGVLMETGFNDHIYTLVSLITGDTSLYLSTGGGIIGGIGHENVVKASKNMIKIADDYIDKAESITEYPFPSNGEIFFYFLTLKGIKSFKALEDDLGNNRHNLSPLFYAGQDVITELRIIQEKNEFDPNVDHKNGDILFNEGLYKDALESYLKVLDSNPNDSDLLNMIGITLNLMGSYDEAIKYFDKCIELDSNNSILFFNKATSLERIELFDKAIECYSKAIELNPDYKEAWNNLGLVYNNLKLHEKAIECYDKVLELDPDYILSLYNKANALDDMGSYDEAIKNYDKALELDPKYYRALINKGLSLNSIGSYEGAIDCYDKVLELIPDDVRIKLYTFNNKGLSLKNMSQNDEAIEYFDKVIELDPKYYKAYYNKGNVFYKLDQIDKAIEWYDKALELEPSYTDALFSKGLALKDLGQKEAALQCFEQVIKIDPTYPDVWFYLAVSIPTIPDTYKKKSDLYGKAIEANPEDGDSWYNKACMESLLGNKDLAIKLLKRAIELYPSLKDSMMKDSDFDGIKDTPEFKELI